MIAIVDYGAGNLKSVANAFGAIGQEIKVTREANDLHSASGIVLPGVGAFGDGMRQLRALGLVNVLTDEVMARKKPYLGICLGLQFLATVGLEHGEQLGLGWLAGRTVALQPETEDFRVPHIGWNDVTRNSSSPLFKDLDDGPTFYFVHSYHFVPDPGHEALVTGTSWHGQRVTAAVERDNVFGVQFHPEKSQRSGLRVLRNWVAHCDLG